MHFSVIFRTIGILLCLFSFAMWPPIIVALIYQEPVIQPFFFSFIAIILMGGFCYYIGNVRYDLQNRDGFMITFLFYLALGIFGSFPFILFNGFTDSFSFTNAVFESVSGITTTGATILTDISTLPKAFLFYRQQIQWLGGMGIIILAVAVLPMIGVGGMQLYKKEVVGPLKDAKLTPRITETAKALWMIYVCLTCVCSICFYYSGMTVFDAICHSFSTISIGGFSTHDESFAYYNSGLIETIAIIFMLISACNFALHYMSFSQKNMTVYWKDTESRMFLLWVCLVVGVSIVLLGVATHFSSETIRVAIFQAVSIATTTGFTSTNFSNWPSSLLILLFFSAIIGGCAGSVSGGIKMMRIQLIYLQIIKEFKRLIHPSGVFLLKFKQQTVSRDVVESVWSFFSIYILLCMVAIFLLLLQGENFQTSFSAVLSCLNNLGPGLGDVALHYNDISVISKWILIIVMLLGRLEIFTFLIIFTSFFWKK